MEAYKLESYHVGRCGNCRRFRNNLSYKVTDKIDKIVCIDCFTMFRNQRLIDSIVVPEKKKETKVKPIRTKPKAIRKGQSNYRQLLCNFIINSDRPIVLNDLINREFGCHATVARNLRMLVKDGKITFQIGKRCIRYYVGTEKKELLDSIPKRQYRISPKDKNKLAIQKIINASNRVLTAKDLRDKVDVCKNTVFRILRQLEMEGKIHLVLYNKDRRFYFCKNDEKLIEELNKYSSEITIDEIEKIIKVSGSVGISLTNVLKQLGKDYTNRYERSYIRRLIEKMEGVKWWKKDSCYHYYFED